MTCACQAAASDWSAWPICSMAATKPTVDMPMPPHSSGISMPSRPSSPISRSRSVSQRPSSQAIGARTAISFWANSRHSSTRSRSASVSEKSIDGSILDRPVQGSYASSMASDRTPHAFPRFDSVEDERRHRKQRLAAALRLFGAFGFDEGAAGHITARDPELTDHFWVNPLGHVVQADPGPGPPAGEQRGRGRRGHVAGEQGGVHHPLARPRGPSRRRRRRPQPLAVRQGVVGAAPAAPPHHPGRLRVLRRPRRLRRLRRRRLRRRGGQAHRPRPRHQQGGDPREPRPAHRRPERRRGGVVVHHHGAQLPGAARSPRRRAPSSRSTTSTPPPPPPRSATTAPAGCPFQPLYDWITDQQPDLLEE